MSLTITVTKEFEMDLPDEIAMTFARKYDIEVQVDKSYCHEDLDPPFYDFTVTIDKDNHGPKAPEVQDEDAYDAEAKDALGEEGCYDGLWSWANINDKEDAEQVLSQWMKAIKAVYPNNRITFSG